MLLSIEGGSPICDGWTETPDRAVNPWDFTLWGGGDRTETRDLVVLTDVGDRRPSCSDGW